LFFKDFSNFFNSFFCAKEKDLYVVFPLEPYLYIYELGNLNLKQKIALQPSYFPTPTGLPKDKSKDYGALRKIAYQNAKYKGVYNLEKDYLLTYYQTKANESLLNNGGSQAAEIEIEKSRKQYLQVLKNNKKITNDIIVPKGYFFVAAYSTNHIVLKKEAITDKLSTTYYKYSLNLK